jgi:hypothetical protein
LQYFDKKYSTAVLEKFQKKLEANASDFLLLPVEEDDALLDDVAYDLLYEGSVNKFRSVKGFVENRYELGKQLDRQTTVSLITDSRTTKESGKKILRIFKGHSSIEFYGMWERVFTFFIVSGNPHGATVFYKRMRTAIKHTHYPYHPEVTLALRDSLMKHLSLSLSMALALKTIDGLTPKDAFERQHQVFRNSNLIRYQYLRTPLINYTTFSGSYLSDTRGKFLEIDDHKVRFSPRYVYLHELVVMANSGLVETGSDWLEWTKQLYLLINGKAAEGVVISEITIAS